MTDTSLRRIFFLVPRQKLGVFRIENPYKPNKCKTHTSSDGHIFYSPNVYFHSKLPLKTDITEIFLSGAAFESGEKWKLGPWDKVNYSRKPLKYSKLTNDTVEKKAMMKALNHVTFFGKENRQYFLTNEKEIWKNLYNTETF